MLKHHYLQFILYDNKMWEDINSGVVKGQKTCNFISYFLQSIKVGDELTGPLVVKYL